MGMSKPIMPNTATASSTAATTSPAVDVDASSALRKLGSTVQGRKELYREALRILVRHFDAPFGAFSVDTSSGCFEDRVHSGTDACQLWKSTCDGLLLDTRYRNIAVAKLYQSDGLQMTFAVIAVPVAERGDCVIGSIAIVTRADGKESAARQLAEIKALVALIGSLVDSIDANQRRDRRAGEISTTGTASVGSHSSLHEFCFSLANGLKTKVGCEQVCIGLVRGAAVRVACISGLDDLYPRSPGVRLIRQAMEECLDADEPISCQPREQMSDRSAADGYLLHRRWHHQTGNSAVASIPLHQDGECVAVLSLRKSSPAEFSASELKKIHDVVAPLMSGLSLLRRGSRSLWQHSVDATRVVAGRWMTRGAWGRKALLAVCIAGTGWVVLGKTEFVLTVPCEVVAEDVRHLAAPFEGRLAAAHVRAGDRVKPGQVLLEFDTTELLLEQQRSGAEKRIAELELAQAVAEGNNALAAQASARVEMAAASLDLVQYRLHRSRITAPTTGTILSEDVVRRVGEVIRSGESLLEFASHSGQSLELHVPQYAAPHLRRGQTGRFTTTSRPDLAYPCQLIQVPASASIIDNRSVFVAESSLSEKPEWLRVGMTGVAKLDAGQRPVWWAGLHRVMDALRLSLWKI